MSKIGQVTQNPTESEEVSRIFDIVKNQRDY